MSKEEYISWNTMSEKEKAEFLSQIHLKLRTMSKAEKFIREHTKHCSNEFEPQKTPPSVYNPWLTPDQARKAVEIAREEMMEKAVDAELYSDGMLTPIIKVSDKEKISNIKFGDKVKLIIIKDKKDI